MTILRLVGDVEYAFNCNNKCAALTQLKGIQDITANDAR